MRRIVWALVMSLALAGCLGGTSEAPVDPNTGGGGGDGGDGGDTGNNTTGDDNATHQWTTTWRNGSFEGTNAVIASQGGASEEFTVAEGAATLTLNLTAEGAELWVDLVPPGCEPGVMSNCSERVSTSGGAATWTAEDPAAGGWTVNLYKGDPGRATVEYAISIAQLAPAGA